jgi:hypothetical protein
MGLLFAALVYAAGLSAAVAVEPLPSRALPVWLFTIPNAQSINFDLYDIRAELAEPASHSETQPHSFFAIKRHIGVAAGYDNGIAHGSLGLYVTVAEWGRWNLGIPSPEIGFGRYHEIDQRTKRASMKTESTILVSLASVHYRGGHIRSIGKDWYFTLEQIFDSRANLTGSQFGFSFSNP